MKTPITVAYGDGIGPEIMKATLSVLDAAGANLQYDTIKIGKEVYLQGNQTGIAPESWATLQKNKIFLKAPITTPQGGGYKSLNVTIRKTLGLYANVRPSRAYTPFVPSNFPSMDLVIVRENEEDLYAGIEHQQTAEVVQCLKWISRPGSEKIVRYAFEYARAHNREKVTCMTKDNIMKHTDGLFHKIFDEVAKEYPDIESEHYIIDIGSAMLAAAPERFDVVVTLNLYGDIISDITAQVAGSVGLGGSSNVGDNFAMFEAIHGSAPDIAGKGIANPSGLINGACLMLVQLGKAEVAEKIQNALLRTLEDGIHTGDIFHTNKSTKLANTQEFTEALIARLGKKPKKILPVTLNKDSKPIEVKIAPYKPVKKEMVGVDVFIDWAEGERDPNVLGNQLKELAGDLMQLKIITNRGVRVYPNGMPSTFCSDYWLCRFVSKDSVIDKGGTMGLKVVKTIKNQDVIDLLQRITDSRFNFVKLEQLFYMDGERAYSLGQGE